MTESEPLQQIDRTFVRFRGRKLSYFSGCDYFRLSSHPKVTMAVREGLNRFGLNVAASRLTTGNHILYRKLEQELAGFFDAPDALLVSTGYMTNLIVAEALTGNFSHALIDQDSHPSMAQATKFLDCPVLRFNRHEPGSAAQAIRRCGPGAKLVLLTDGMFSRDGSVAPLAEYARVLPKDAWMVVDDAHAAGVLGRTGKGSLEQQNIKRSSRIIQTVTLSKAFGAYGGAILSTPGFRQRIFDRSQLFVGSTPLPLPLANAARAGIAALRKDPTLRRRLESNTELVRSKLREFGIPATPGPIIMLSPKNAREANELKGRLLRGGIYPAFIRYPGGPAEGYFRFVISSQHSRRQLEALAHILFLHLTGRCRARR